MDNSEKNTRYNSLFERLLSYMRRQKRSGVPPSKEAKEGNDKDGRRQEGANLLDKKSPKLAGGLSEDMDISERESDDSEAEKRGTVTHKRHSRRKLSMDSEDYDVIQLSASDVKVSAKSEPGSEMTHSQGSDEGPRAGSVDQGMPLMSMRRWIPTGLVKRTMPQLSDRKHIIDTSRFGSPVLQKKLRNSAMHRSKAE